MSSQTIQLMPWILHWSSVIFAHKCFFWLKLIYVGALSLSTRKDVTNTSGFWQKEGWYAVLRGQCEGGSASCYVAVGGWGRCCCRFSVIHCPEVLYSLLREKHSHLISKIKCSINSALYKALLNFLSY